MKFDKNKIIKLTYNDINKIIDDFVNHLTIPIDCILAVSRGGLIPAVIISHKLGNIPIHTITLKSYHEIDNIDGHVDVVHSNIVLERCDTDLKLLNEQNVLIVDDIIDSGKTFDFIEHQLQPKKQHSYFALCSSDDQKNRLINKDTVYLNKGKWIKFAWEI